MTPQSAHLRDVTLAMLAGGEGSRMGKPKSLLEVAGQPILAFLLKQFALPGPTLLVTSPGREKPAGAGQFDQEVTDPISGQGPLRGVLTALESCRTPLLFITNVDMPGITADHAKWMIERLASNLSGIVCRHNGRVQPFPMLVRTSIWPQVKERFDAGERSVQCLANMLKRADPDWPESVWTNLNHPDEFVAWAATVSASPPGHR